MNTAQAEAWTKQLYQVLPDEIIAVLGEWFVSSFDLSHFWEADETYYIAGWNEGDLYFVRVFQVNGEWVISQDNIEYGPDKTMA